MLLIAMIVAYFVVNGAVDITSMITGNQPPSKTYRDAKGENKEDGPLIRTLKAWWADAIEDIDEAKKRKRLESKEEKERERQRRKDERQAWIDELNERTEDEKRKKERERRGRRKTWRWSRDEEAGEESDRSDPDDRTWDSDDRPWEADEEIPPVDESGEDSREELPPVDESENGTVDPDSKEEKGRSDAEEPEEIFDADIVDDEPKAIDPGEAGPMDPGEAGLMDPPDGPEIPELRVIEGDRPDDEEWTVYGRPNLYAVTREEEPEVVEKNRDGSAKTPFQQRAQGVTAVVDAAISAATGTPMQTQVNQAGGTTVTTQATTVEGGISAHINWTQKMADYQVRAASHVEIVWASMFHGDNGPARLAKIRRIQELHRMLNQAYLDVNGILVSDRNTIGDAYAATGMQAGDKRYTTS